MRRAQQGRLAGSFVRAREMQGSGVGGRDRKEEGEGGGKEKKSLCVEFGVGDTLCTPHVT